MHRSLAAFSEELRAVGVPVSMVETTDAAQALCHTDLGNEQLVRETLAATLVKRSTHRTAFDIAFDVFFVGRAFGPDMTLDPTTGPTTLRAAVAVGALAF